MIRKLLLYKDAYLNTNKLDVSLPSSIVSLLQEFDDVFPEEVPHDLIFEELNIKSISCLMLPFQIDQPIEAIPKRQMSYKGISVN